MQNNLLYYGTLQAIQAIAQELDLSYSSLMQDWSYEVAKPENFELYLEYYKKEIDKNKKFVLMEMLVQAVEDQSLCRIFLKYWEKLKFILTEEFELHAYTIRYWSCLDNENLDECWLITPYMRELWFKKHYKNRTDALSSEALAKVLVQDLLDYSLILETSFQETVETITQKIEACKAMGNY